MSDFAGKYNPDQEHEQALATKKQELLSFFRDNTGQDLVTIADLLGIADCVETKAVKGKDPVVKLDFNKAAKRLLEIQGEIKLPRNFITIDNSFFDKSIDTGDKKRSNKISGEQSQPETLDTERKPEQALRTTTLLKLFTEMGLTYDVITEKNKKNQNITDNDLIGDVEFLLPELRKLITVNNASENATIIIHDLAEEGANWEEFVGKKRSDIKSMGSPKISWIRNEPTYTAQQWKEEIKKELECEPAERRKETGLKRNLESAKTEILDIYKEWQKLPAKGRPKLNYSYVSKQHDALAEWVKRQGHNLAWLAKETKDEGLIADFIEDDRFENITEAEGITIMKQAHAKWKQRPPEQAGRNFTANWINNNGFQPLYNSTLHGNLNKLSITLKDLVAKTNDPEIIKDFK